jgi:hypothetical protein
MSRINRRQFVAGAGALLAAPALAKAATPVWTYRGTSGRVLVGWLTTTDPERHELAIAALRTETGYRRPLSYASTDRLKLPFALAVIDHLAASDDMAFTIEGARNGKPARGGVHPELEQLAAFLTGCAYGAIAGARHPLKRALIDALRERTALIG